MRRIAVLMLCVFGSVAHAADLPRVLDGYTIERVTTPEQTLHPMMGGFDDDGRLYIAESAGTNRPATELLKDPQDLIRVLEDTDGDGKFDKSTVFADKLVFPQGVLWHRGAVYTCSSPYLWKLTDTDGDGVCDDRKILVKSFGFSGNAADIHGPFLSPDGRLWWCDGRHGHEIRHNEKGSLGGEDTAATTPPKPEPGLPNEAGELISKGKAARIFSCKLDGTHLHVHAGGGMDNPVEVDFLETGEALGTVNLFYDGPRGDCLVHWVEGGVYPRYDQQACIDEFPSTGDPLGPVHNYGHVAVSGLTRYRSDQFFGPIDEANPKHSFFVTQFNTHKLVRTIVSRERASFQAESHEDFLVSDNPDFHPTDVVEDADGSLLVIDTGGWFRIGCPNSQVAKPDIAGAVYRIKKVGKHAVKDPRGKEIAWDKLTFDELLKLLEDLRPTVARRAIHSIESRQFDAIQLRQAMLSIASRFRRDQGQPPIHMSVIGTQRYLQLRHRLHSMSSTHPASGSIPQIQPLANNIHRPIDSITKTIYLWNNSIEVKIASERFLDQGSRWPSLAEVSDSPGVLRAWAEANSQSDAWRSAIQSLKQPRNLMARPERLLVSDLMAMLTGEVKPDRVLEHSLITLLIRANVPQAVADYLNHPSPSHRRIALLSLHQIPGYELTREQVLPLLDTDDMALQALVLKIISQHPGWAPEAVTLLDKWLGEETFSTERAAVLRGFLLARVSEPEVAALIATRLEALPPKYAGVPLLLDVIARSPRATFVVSWKAGLLRTLQQGENSPQLQALTIIADRNLAGMDEVIALLAANPQQPHAIRLAAYSALWPRREVVQSDEFTYLTDRLDVADQPTDLLTVARTLADAPLSDDQLKALIPRLPQVGPLGVPVLLRAFERSQSVEIGTALVEKLTAVQNEVRIPVEELHRLLRQYPARVLTAAEPLFAASGVNLAAQAAKLEQLAPLTTGGNIEAGRTIFFHNKSACASCHRIGKDGGNVGPDLTTIGASRETRDLLEAVVLPSSSFARGFRPYIIVTTDGKIHTGVMTRESTDSITLRTATLAEIHIPRAEIDELRESPTSIMPQGLETRLSESELRDLLAYLKSLK